MTTEKPLVKILLFYGPAPGCARIASLFVPIPPSETQGTQAGGPKHGRANRSQ
jgi:hypothetical protein